MVKNIFGLEDLEADEFDDIEYFARLVKYRELICHLKDNLRPEIDVRFKLQYSLMIESFDELFPHVKGFQVNEVAQKANQRLEEKIKNNE